jgi:tRNA nucleotidyltransferase (CCA-adding enzyme)
MQIYLVGGAVRDELLGLPIGERDYVVVGATVSMMLAQGFVQVGRDFPVFLHPDTHEEYALARTERKVAAGYQGFQVFASPEVSLEEDLQRRDLTINAMARGDDQVLIDPYGGQNDLKARVFRHVGPAFVEDPVRVLRLARFSAQFTDFSIAQETVELMDRMVASGELDALVPERVWQEVMRGLKQAQPSRMLAVLKQTRVLGRLMPELSLDDPRAAGVLRLIDTAWSLDRQHTLNTDQLAQMRFAWLMTLCPASSISGIGERLRVPQEFTQLAMLSCSHQDLLAAIATTPSPQDRAGVLLELIQRCDAIRRGPRFELCTRVWAALGWADAELLTLASNAARLVDGGAIAKTLPGGSQDIALAIQAARKAAIAQALIQK